MIKFALRKNLIYPLQMLIWATIREIDNYLINFLLKFSNSSIFTLFMFIGEFLAGLIFHLKQKKFLPKNIKRNQSEFFKIGLVKKKEKEINTKDNKAKTIFLILCLPFFDFVQFLLSLEIYKFDALSNSLEIRFRGIFTIYTALFYYYFLKEPLIKHQIFSLIIIVICLLIIIITEIIFQEINIFLTYSEFFFCFIIILFIQLLHAMQDIIEKYLFEYKNLSPFLIIMLEGLFGFIFTLFYIFYYKTCADIIEFYQNNYSAEFIFLIIGCILYIISSGGKNLFRVVAIKIFNPMTVTFMDYILNPFYIIFYFSTLNDFISNDKKNCTYFIINLIISCIITFCGGIFNEFIIIFCCRLEHETHNQITHRSYFESQISNLYVEESEDDEFSIEDEKSYYIIEMKEKR